MLRTLVLGTLVLGMGDDAVSGLDPAGLRAAEAACASEPIHRPGAVQAGWALYVLDADTGAVIGRSVGAPPFAAPDAAALRAAARSAGAVPRGVPGIAGADGTPLAGSLHRADAARVLLELEPAEDPAEAARALDGLGDAIDALAQAADIAAAARAAATHMRAMTGYDRVMVYRFADDWSGEVVAESLAGPAIDSFAGLRFPASDIPPQARALYAANRVRLIADARAAPVPLEPVPLDPAAAGGDPAGADLVGTDLASLDLGRAAGRAVSPVHLAYLANMGVRASMSVAIGHGDALWGLLACHHLGAPRAPGHRARQAAETLGRALAWRIAELEATAAAALRARLAGLAGDCSRALADPAVGIDAGLAPLGATIRDAVGAAAFLLLDGAGTTLAACDAGEVPAGLGAALAQLSDAEGGVETDRLGAPDTLGEAGTPGEAGGLGQAGADLARAGWFGLLGRRIIAGGGPEGRPGGGEVWAVWLRREFRHEVVWAGNPDKALGEAAPGALPSLSPRRSFASWREAVAGRSAPFGAAARTAADLLRENLREALLRRAQSAAAALEDMRRRNEAIRFFADAAVHDLREPLWQIQVFAGALQDELQAGSEATELATTIETSAGRMRAMLDDLAEFAIADSPIDDSASVPLDAVVAEAAQDIGEQLRASGGAIEVSLAGLPPVQADAARLRRVFQNLFSNAIKYRRPNPALRIEVCGALRAGTLACTVADNGTGFEPADRERIFEPFLRLGQSTDGTAQGLGLGLAICRRIVQAHGGSISADAQPGAGARFELTLRLNEVAA